LCLNGSSAHLPIGSTAPGVAGFFERPYAPPAIRRIYYDAICRLDRYASEQVIQRETVGSRP
jgi:hypothetical protein